MKKSNSGQFGKGHTVNNGRTPWNKGAKTNVNTRLKQSLVKSGKTWEEIYGYGKAVQMRESARKRMLHNNHNKLGLGQGGGYTGRYKEWYFRSLLELSFILQAEKIGLIIYNAEKMFPIPLGDGSIYRPDFFAPELNGRKCIIEIKPSKQINSDIVKLKSSVAAKFCSENGMIYIIGYDKLPLNNNTLKSLYEQGLLLFSDKTKLKFEKRIYAGL